MSTSTTFIITTQDGFPISATLFLPSTSSFAGDSTVGSSSRHPVIIAAATGVPATFYHSFAGHLSSSTSRPVLVFDYRYLGLSWPDSVDQSDPDQKTRALEHARDTKISVEMVLDFEATLGWLIEKYKGNTVVAIGHSVGGHLLPLLNPQLLESVERALFVGAMNPYLGFSKAEKMRREQTAQVLKICHERGYYPARELNLGNHNLPLGVVVEWYGWMEFPEYFAHDKAEILQHYRIPTLSIALADDMIAEGNSMMTDAILLSLPNAPATRIHLDPLKLNWPSPIGHLHAFAPVQKEVGIWSMMMEYVVRGTLSMDGGETRDFNGGCFGFQREVEELLRSRL